jgi:hypothetical protein
MTNHERLNNIMTVMMVILALADLRANNARFFDPAALQITGEQEDGTDHNQKNHISENFSHWNIWQSIAGENISMLSPIDGWIVDFEGKTSNLYRLNGSAWQSFGTVTHPDYNIKGGDLQMVSPLDGWLMFYGDLFDTSYHPPKSVIYRWDGVSWNLFDTLGGSVPGIALSQVDILSSTDIWATAGTMFGTWFYHWNGSSWAQTQYLCCDISLISDIEMVSPANGWAVGAAGGGHLNIARWNGGTWFEVASPTSTVLESISMVSDADGWIVGRNGVILQWNNVAWSTVASPVTTNLNSIQMISTTDGWAVGDSGVILHWDGNSWSQITGPTLANLYEVIMVSANDGWIVGDGVILRYVVPPVLSSNYASGQSGSFFNLAGSNFPSNSSVDVTINGVTMSSPISSDPSGGFTFTLSTQQAGAGRYDVTATVNPSAMTNIWITPTGPVRQKEGDWTVIDIPGGIALKEVFVPIVKK